MSTAPALRCHTGHRRRNDGASWKAPATLYGTTLRMCRTTGSGCATKRAFAAVTTGAPARSTSLAIPAERLERTNVVARLEPDTHALDGDLGPEARVRRQLMRRVSRDVADIVAAAATADAGERPEDGAVRRTPDLGAQVVRQHVKFRRLD